MWAVYLHKGEEEIYYGDLTKIAPVKKTMVVKGERVDKPKELYDKQVNRLRNRIIRELNNLLPNACIRQKTMYYYSVEK